MFNLRASINNNRGFLVLLLAFALIRTAVADYNPVPSGSMHPNILEGDVVLVNRLAYNLKLPLTDILLAHLGDPQRGDVVTFSSPRDGVRLVKRIVGLPGDVIAMENKKLTVNGQPANYLPLDAGVEEIAPGQNGPVLRLREEIGSHAYEVQWLADLQNASTFGPLSIPSDQYLMLGDNRDNSADSRYIGLVTRERLIGRVERILVSADILGNWQPRFERFGKSFYQ